MKMLRNAMMHTTPAQAPALESAVGRSAGAKPPPPSHSFWVGRGCARAPEAGVPPTISTITPTGRPMPRSQHIPVRAPARQNLPESVRDQ